MNTFKDTVKKISNSFLTEAKQSPQLLNDMANMEYYMAESYSGRVFIELLQNADDAKSSRIILYKNNGNLYFGNNGKPFDESDLITISRSGASDKKRGKTIGYRGIGFKSTSFISNEIIIYSNDTYFTFSKNKCAKLLNRELNEVPTIRIPILLEDVPNEIKEEIHILKNKGYSTIFVFTNAKIGMFMEEIQTIDSGFFLFLNHIYECKIDLSSQYDVIYEIDRFNDSGNQHILVKDKNKSQEWMVVKNRDSYVAFLVENGKIVPCSDSEAVFHCYLPTLDKSIVLCKINADFSTDPSRKHLTLDEKTYNSLKKVADIFANIIEMAIQDADTGKYKNILKIFLYKNVLSKPNIFLDEEFLKLIDDRKILRLNNGSRISLKEYKLFPATFDLDNSVNIRESSDALAEQSLLMEVYDNIDNVDEFIEQFSDEKFGLEEITKILKDCKFVANLNDESYIQLVTNVIRESKIKNSLDPNYGFTAEEILVKGEDDNVLSIKEIVKSDKKLNLNLKSELEERLGDSEIRWLQEKTGLQNSDLEASKEENDIIIGKKTELKKSNFIKPHISRWRDAEEKCVEIEKYMGNDAIDVSVKNLGYDVISTTPDGTKRYIEVKSVKKDYSFALTNNEYTAAHELGEKYLVCLLCEDENKLSVKYINNPLVSAKFEKRIRQWEWICLEFDSTEQSFDIE